MKKTLRNYISEISKWNRLVIGYLIITTIIFIIVFLFLKSLNFPEIIFKPLNITIHLNIIKYILYFILIIFYIFAFISVEDFLQDFIPDKVRIKLGQNISRWKSKEFDTFVGDDLIDLYFDSQKLLDVAKQYPAPDLSDYSFIVLPAAKAYEGVLKKILVKTGLVLESELLEKPELSLNSFFNPVGNISIFNSLKDKARDKAVPYIIYATYQECRNEILHYDSYRNNRITLEGAEFYLMRINDALEKAYNAFKSKI